MLQRILRIVLIILDAFLALTAFAGGIGLVTGVAAPPTEMLAGSPFTGYLIPALSLFVIVGGCASYSTALHLMRTGAIGVLVGVGPGNACTTRGVLGVGVPQATAIADAAAARREGVTAILLPTGKRLGARGQSPAANAAGTSESAAVK